MFGGFFDISMLQKELSPSVFTWNSMQGVLLILVLIGMGVCLSKKITKFFFYGCMYIVFVQILHVFAHSSLGAYVPVLGDIFKYDVFQSLAQLCVGTPVSDVLLYVQVFINQTFGLVFDMILVIWNIIKPGLEFLKESFMQFRE